MKYNAKLLMVAFASLSGMAFAGGNITPEPTVIEEPRAVIYEKSPYYIGLGLSAVSVRSTDSTLSFVSEKSGQDRVGAVSILAGYDLDTYLAVEGRYMVSFLKDDFVEMNNIALYVKPQYPVTEEVSVYGLLGYGNVTLDNTHNSGVDGDKAGFQWGLGTSYQVTEDIALFAEYRALARDIETDANKMDVDTVSLGFSYRF